MKYIKRFWIDGQAQDLIEYTFILAFVALASAGLFMSAGISTSGIWAQANSALQASAAAPPSSGGGCTAPSYSTSFPGDSPKACFNPVTESYGPAGK
jgi:Flp pilus assembly pilin Flp